MSVNNRISNPVNPSNISLLNANKDVLDGLSQINGKLAYKGKIIGSFISVIKHDSSNNNITYDNVSTIEMDGVTIQKDQFNDNTVKINIDSLNKYLQNNNIVCSFYNIQKIETYSTYIASNRDFLICNADHSIDIYLPPNPSDNDYIKIATLQKINENNVVSIFPNIKYSNSSYSNSSYSNSSIENSQNVNTLNQEQLNNLSKIQKYIYLTGQLKMVIDTSFSSVQLIYDQSMRTWKTITPFIPMSTTTNTLNNQDVKNLMRKHDFIFG